MTWILGLLTTHWREALIAVLFAALTISVGHGRKIAIEWQNDKTTWSIQVASAESAANAVRETSQKTLEKINREHTANLAAAEKNAIANYRRRFGTGLRDTGPLSQSNASIAYCAKCPDGPSEEFLAACGADAYSIGEFQRWIRGNKFPVEGE